MPYFAEIDANNVVQRVIVADQKFVDSGAVGNPKRWVQTSKDGSVTKHFAGVGHVFDAALGDFLPPKPYPSWSLDAATNEWRSPKAEKNPDLHTWDEAKEEWVEKQ